MVNATDCRSVSWGFDSLPWLLRGGVLGAGSAVRFGYSTGGPSSVSVGGGSAPSWGFEVEDCSPIGGNATVVSGPGYVGGIDAVSGASVYSVQGSMSCILPL